MNKSRLEAFSDGVIAIIITIMVLEMKVPHAADFSALKELLPVFLSYVLSFIYVGKDNQKPFVMANGNSRFRHAPSENLFFPEAVRPA